LLRIEPLTAEPLQEFIGIGRIPKTINVEPFPIVEHGMTSGARRQILTLDAKIGEACLKFEEDSKQGMQTLADLYKEAIALDKEVYEGLGTRAARLYWS
jgi:hypothetical protein